ncbi:Protein Jade-1 [Vitis vinifera]|uniref:Protein Jade-1 n=1 Tax=Vitis vinifera TaxID=29760 RepID=A0A438KN01_VITVI|nr:Protein Jade-1 [Vitis vinifera]
MWGWALLWFVVVMTGGRCHRQKKMMGRGAERGCGTEEKPCPISRAPAKISAKQPGNPGKEVSLGVDLYAQARKALSDRCPFETEEALANTVSTLPSGLACLLSKHSDSRKRHKKSHSDTKSSSRQSRGANIWLETEGYFRELAFPDIETLVEVSSSVSLATEKNFLIPYIGNPIEANGVSSELQNGENANGNGIVVKEEDKKEDNQLMEIDSVETEVLPPEEKACSQSPLSSGLEWLLGLKNKVLLTSERPNKKRKLLGSDAGLEKLIIARPCEGNSSLCHFCCTGDMGEQSNRLIVCRCCNVAVHQKCYGVQEDIDEESWLCTWCWHKNDKNDASNGESVKPCVLCPKQGGALKPLHKSEDEESMEFSHLFCSQWMPEVYVEDTRKMEPIMNIDGIKETRKKLVCNVCKVKYGACVRCSNEPVECPTLSANRLRSILVRSLLRYTWTLVIQSEFLAVRALSALYGTEVLYCREGILILLFLCGSSCFSYLVSSVHVLVPYFTLDGACRTSFHPICAREARHRMEIWGKFGCDNLELRAFCLKHSEVQDVSSTQQLGDFSAADGSNTSSHPPVTSVNKPQKLKIGLRNGDKIAVHMETPDNNSNKLSDGEFQETGLPNTRSKAELMSGCADAQQLIGMRMLETINSEGVNPSDSINLALILKKLIERGKVSVKDVALDIGVSPDSLAATLADDHLVPDLQCKILKWLKDHAYMGTLQKNLKVKIKSAISSKDEIGEVDGSNAVLVSETDIPEPVPVKSVPPRRRTKSNIRILKDNRIICSSEETFSDNGTVMDEVNTDQLAGELENSSKGSFPSATEKKKEIN